MCCIASLLAGCFGVHSGTFQSSAILTGNNYTILKRDAVGTSQTTTVLFIGGLSKDALVAEAKADLMETYNVTGNQQLVNVSVDWKIVTTPIYFVVNTRKCTVTADIIEFNK